MGSPKAILPFGRTSFSRSLVDSMRRGGLADVLVVVGHEPGPILSHICDLGTRFAYNPAWPKGQITSIQTAIRSCGDRTSGILLMTVDQPGVLPGTIRKMVREHHKHPDLVWVASFRHRAGHPVIFPRSLFAELLRVPPSQGANGVVRRNPDRRRFVCVSDPAVIRDIDTPDQMKNGVKQYGSAGG